MTGSREESLLDNEIFLEAQRFMGPKFSKVINYFFEDSESYIQAIQEGVNTGKAERIIPAAHTLKSSSRQLGAMALSDLAGMLEEKARLYSRGNADFAELRVLADQIVPLAEKTKTLIEKIIIK